MSLLIALSVTAALVQEPAAPGTALLYGRVLEDGTGTAVPEAEVTVMPLRSGPILSPAFESPISYHTDREGRFQVRGLQPGRYRVAVQRMGYALPLPPGAGSATTVDLSAGEERSISLSLQRGAALVGQVLNDAGDPLVNVRVMAMRQAPSGQRYASGASGARVGLIPIGQGAQTNDLGAFRLFGLPPGDYYVQAAPGPDLSRTIGPRTRTLIPTYFPDATDPAGAHAITLGAGQTSDAIVIRMLDAPAFRVSGVVVDETGRPVANAIVRLDSDPADVPTFSFGRYLQTRTDASGVFTIGHVTSATYTLVAIAPLITSSASDPRASGSTTMSAGTIGPITGRLTTESRNGITTEYRDDNATRAPISVHESAVNGLQVVVRLPR